MQAQTEPKLRPETANMEFEQVITQRSATLKGDLKVNLEPKWFLRRFPWKFHVSDFRATLLFTSYCVHVLITIQVPGLWRGKNWNQNISKKRSWFIFGYVGFGGARSFPCWVEVLEQVSPAGWTWNSEPGKCPRGCGARRPHPELPLLGRSPRASVSRWVNVESNLEPVSVLVALAPGGPAQSFPCWVKVLEQVSPAGSTWNLT